MKSNSCLPITARHWLPKFATATIPVAGIFMGAYLADRVRQEVSVFAPFPLRAEAQRHQNHYTIGILINSLICMASAIACIAMGIFRLVGGMSAALLFGGFAALSGKLLHRDIAHLKDLERGICPYSK